jgi:hypothetical protein
MIGNAATGQHHEKEDAMTIENETLGIAIAFIWFVTTITMKLYAVWPP